MDVVMFFEAMDLSSISTAQLLQIAKSQAQSGAAPENMLKELGIRYLYRECPREDKAMIAEFDRTIIIPLLGSTRLPPGAKHVPGAKLPAVPIYYKRKRASSKTRTDASTPLSYSKVAGAFSHNSMSHVFISYVRENDQLITKLCDHLQQQGVEVWRDRDQIRPGQRWQQAIRQAIQSGAFFLACFSAESTARESTYMNEELTLAIEELRKRPTDRAWFIPVLLDECPVPDRDIGGGETLRSLQWVSLWQDWQEGVRRIVSVVKPESAKRPTEALVESLRDQRAKALSLKLDLSEQAIFILRQFVESGDTEFFYSDWGNGQWSLQLCHGEQSQIGVLEPRFIQDDLDNLVSLRLLSLEYNSQGTPIFHITRNAVRFINMIGGADKQANPGNE